MSILTDSVVNIARDKSHTKLPIIIEAYPVMDLCFSTIVDCWHHIKTTSKFAGTK